MPFLIFLGVVGIVGFLLDSNHINWAMATIAGYAVFFLVDRWISAKYYEEVDIVDSNEFDD